MVTSDMAMKTLSNVTAGVQLVIVSGHTLAHHLQHGIAGGATLNDRPNIYFARCVVWRVDCVGWMVCVGSFTFQQ